MPIPCLYAWSSGSASIVVIEIGTSSIVATIPIASAFANDGIAVANYQVTVFAFSEDLLTPDPFSGLFNISAHSQNFVGP